MPARNPLPRRSSLVKLDMSSDWRGASTTTTITSRAQAPTNSDPLAHCICIHCLAGERKFVRRQRGALHPDPEFFGDLSSQRGHRRPADPVLIPAQSLDFKLVHGKAVVHRTCNCKPRAPHFAPSSVGSSETEKSEAFSKGTVASCNPHQPQSASVGLILPAQGGHEMTGLRSLFLSQFEVSQHVNGALSEGA